MIESPTPRKVEAAMSAARASARARASATQ